MADHAQLLRGVEEFIAMEPSRAQSLIRLSNALHLQDAFQARAAQSLTFNIGEYHMGENNRNRDYGPSASEVRAKRFADKQKWLSSLRKKAK